MNNEEKREKLKHMQTFFLKCFWISFVLLLIASLLCILMHDYQVAIASKYFQTDAEDLGEIILMVFGIWKVLIIQFTLVPALAIWCMTSCCKCRCNKDND